MSILIRRVVTLALTLVTLTLLAACGPSNNVRLIYNTNTSAVLPLPGSPSVAVVMFNDERTRQYIGERKDGSVFTASSTIADWFSRSLADELGRQGVQVSFASTLEQARAANPTYIVTGTITDVWLQEQSATRVQCTIKAKVALSNKKGVLYSENLSSTQERQFIRHRKPAVRHAQGPAGSGRQEDPEPDPLIPETPSIKTRGEENRFLSLFLFPL